VIDRGRLRADDGTVLYAPGYEPETGNAHEYHALWIRDFAYMVEGAGATIPDSHIAPAFVFALKGQRADGAIPDNVQANGKPDYLSAGKKPVTDGPQFMVKLAYEHYRRTRRPTLFRAHYHDLIRGMRWVPRRDSLVWIDPAHPHSSYGFTDGIAKTGYELFSSVLYVEASKELASLSRAVGMRENARRWARITRRSRQALSRLWDSAEGMFLAASRDNRQTDVWGSAYAAFSGIATRHQTQRIARWLRSHYGGIVQRGQVRHTAPNTYWQRTFGAPAGAFQNGAYWGTATGWVAATLARIDRQLAHRMIRELAADYRTNGVNEFVGGPDVPKDVHCVGFANYGANAALPLQAVRRIATIKRRSRRHD
jgi:hypothetical protein